MYKSKLQELCHQKGWSLPSYSSAKDGPDHNPHFTASVNINGLSFHTTGFCKTSKEAQNEAAMIACDQLVSAPPPRPRPQLIFIPHERARDATSSPSGPSSVSNKMKDKASNELNNAPAVEENKSPKNHEISNGPLTHGNVSVVKDEFEGMQFLYKNQLQSYAQRRNISLPIYSCVHEGLAHALRFKAKVTIDGQTFESPGFSHTLKEAEHAAAKAALMSLSMDGTEVEESVVYKNLLQELIQKEGLSLPVYETIRSGASHMPTFSSTVEVEGKVFHGKAAKTKKQAEMNAAKLAYFDLNKRRSSRMANYLHPSSQELEAIVCTSSSSNSGSSFDLQQNLKPIDMTASTTITVSEDHREESRGGDQEMDSAKAIPVNAKVSTHDSVPSSKPSNMKIIKESSSSDKIYAYLRDPFPSVPSSLDDGPSSPSTASKYSGSLAVESDIKAPIAKETSSLLCNRVTIYPRMPGMVPKDVTILPISDDKWVAVSLEFPDLAVQ